MSNIVVAVRPPAETKDVCERAWLWGGAGGWHGFGMVTGVRGLRVVGGM